MTAPLREVGKGCLALVLYLGCGGVFCGNAARAEATLDDDVRAVGDATNALGFDLYQALGRDPKNLVFSPLSVETALALTSAGARGQTAEQMARVLHATSLAGRLKRLAEPPLPDADQPGPPASELRIADALWAQQDYHFQPPFLALAEQNYAGGLHHVNFQADSEAARRTINLWVEKQTHDKIRDLIPPGAIDPRTTRMVLTNAVYFRAPWANAFEPANTRERAFHLADGSTVMAPLMYQQESFAYLRGEGFQAVQLRYAQSALAMELYLPDLVDGLPTLERLLTADRLTAWGPKFEFLEVRLTLPRFKITSNFQLGKTLATLGMPDAFDAQKADFSGIASQESICLSEVVHQAYVDVNERGTEAAAATGMLLAASAAPLAEPRVFTADHPFLFLIRDPSSEAILFLGRVSNPK
jgi:serpin B